MHEYAASVTGVFKTIFILLALYFAVRILGRLLSPFTGNKQKPGAGNAARGDLRKEGEVRIEYPEKDRDPADEKKGKGGDYIDFEEVD
jgi:hypothetical protein